MITKKDLVIAVLLTFCLTATLFMIIPTRSSLSTSEYNPLADLTGPEGVPDGVINMRDINYVCDLFQTTGTPINWTQLLEDVENLKNKVAELETNVVYLNDTVLCLNETVVYLNSTQGLGAPDYDSGWVSIDTSQELTFTHNLNTTEVLVYVIGKDSDPPGINQINYGSNVYSGIGAGAYWHSLTQNNVKVHRESDDVNWDQVRVMIWKIPEP